MHNSAIVEVAQSLRNLLEKERCFRRAQPLGMRVENLGAGMGRRCTPSPRKVTLDRCA